MIVRDEVKRLPLILKADGGLHGTEVISDVEFSAGLKTGENAHGAECGFQAGNRSSGEGILHSSEKSASTISKHFSPGITLRSIWFMT